MEVKKIIYLSEQETEALKTAGKIIGGMHEALLDSTDGISSDARELLQALQAVIDDVMKL